MMLGPFVMHMKCLLIKGLIKPTPHNLIQICQQFVFNNNSKFICSNTPIDSACVDLTEATMS